MDNQNNSVNIKIASVGEYGIGKSTILYRYLNNKFPIDYMSTIGLDFYMKLITKLWDIPGSERYVKITYVYYKGAQGLVFMYDISNRQSFDKIQSQISHYNNTINNGTNKAILSLVGLKQDLQQQRQVSEKEGQDLANSLGMLFFETSAKTSLNVNSFYEKFLDQIIENM